MFWNIFYQTCERKGTKPNPVAKELKIASSTVTSWKNGSIPNGETLLKIANYLDVSVDYLLGRTDSPQGISQINTGDVGNNSNVNVHNEKKTADSDSDDTISELVAVFKKLNFCDKAKVMSLIAELSINERK